MHPGQILTPKIWRGAALALLIGVISGYLANLIGLPLPWMLGPMIATTIASVLSAPIKGPTPIRPYVVPVIGVMLGSAITSEIFSQLGDWLISFLVLPPFLAAAAGASYLIYRHIGRYDPVTAFFSSMPGGITEIVLMVEEAGGDDKRVALAHAARILLVIAFVGLFFGLVLGVSAGGQRASNWVSLSDLAWLDYAVLGGCAVLGVPLAKLLRMPAAPILGPMILSGAAHIAHLVELPPPTVLVICAQIVMGTSIGCRFIGVSPAEIGRDLFLGIWASLGMLATGVGFAWLVATLTGTELSQAFLAYAPGGLTEMSLLAFSMGGEIAYVSITHIVRIAMVIAAAPLVFRLFGAKR